MPLFRDTAPYYDGSTLLPYSFEWGGVVATDASGVATWYLTDNGLTGGNALFTNIPLGSIIVTPWNTVAGSAIYIQATPIISGDFKNIKCTIKQNSSLLGLGLIPFATAPAGVMVSLRCRGVQ